MEKQKNILCVHQGYELYGSDRSFVLSVSTLKDLYPYANIDVMIPKDGSIKQLIEPVCNTLIINKKLAILRKKELKKNPVGLIYKILKGIFSALNTSAKYDLVYINTIVVLDYILAARFMRCKTVLHIREIPTGLQKTLFSRIISFSKMNLIFNSSNTLHAFNISDAIPKTVILNGVKGFTDITSKKNIGSPINILLIGRLTLLKGQIFFLEALHKLLNQERYNVNVRIVGEVFEDQVEYKYNLHNFVKNNNLNHIVEFKTFTQNPKNEYKWSDIVIIPSVQPESFGRVAIEAMSSNRCVVASNLGGLTEIIENNVNGILFEANNIDSLVNSLKTILDKPELIKTYSNVGYNTFLSKFSEDIYQKKFKSIVSQIL